MKQARPSVDPVHVFVARDGSKAARERVQRLLSTGELQIRTHPPHKVDDASLWATDAERSFGRMAHGFIAAPDWLGAAEYLDDEQRRQIVQLVVTLVASWSAAADADAGMAFHDETTAQRVINLAAFRDQYRDSLNDAQDRQLRQVLEPDIALLSSADFYGGVNNHGMFQDIALLVAAGLYEHAADPAQLRRLALGRLRHYFSTCFTSDGIHVENTPTYHVMISRYLALVVRYAAAVGSGEEFEGLAEVLHKAELYAAHAVTPQGTFPPVSDTAVMPLDTAGPRNTFPGAEFLGAISLGTRGTLPAERAFVAPSSGYAIHRSAWSDARASYVFFSAAYNADYHKHSDELSLYVVNDGVELLREAGPFGYDRSNPFTAYGFSGAAHNTLLVDGRGLPRTDQQSAKTTLEDVGSSATSIDVLGTTERFDGITWKRRLQVSDQGAGAPISITDQVSSTAEHDYEMLWHFGPDVSVIARGNAAELFAEDGRKVAELTWCGDPSSSVRLIRGQRFPDVQGWAFPTMGRAVPAQVLSVSFESRDLQVAWTLRTEDFTLADRGVNAVTGDWQTYLGEKPVNYLLDVPAGDVERLAIVFTAIHQPGDFTYNYRSSLRDLPGAKLFLLDDFGDQGAYYLANGRNYAEFRSVQGLIRTIMHDLGIDASRVTTIGSSKGGSAAILHGVTLGVSKVIAGAPQTRLGSFLSNPHPNVLAYIAGGTSKADVAWADGVMTKALASGVRATGIDIVVGRADHHFARHVQPFAAVARSLGYDAVQVLPLPGTPLARIGAAFRSYLESWVRATSDAPSEQVLPHVAVHDQATGEIGAVVALPTGWQASFKLVRDREVIESTGYQSAGQVVWPAKSPGNYRFRIYCRPPGGDPIAFGTGNVRVTQTALN